MFTNHCDWADVLIVRGRCFGDHKVCFRANRILEQLLWKSSKMRRPYVVYREGKEEHLHSGRSLGADPVPDWLRHECVYKDLCQCNLAGPRHPDWHHPGSLYSNVVSRRRQLFKKQCGCSCTLWSLPFDCIKNTKNTDIAIKVSRVVIHVLSDVPPSVPQREEPLVSVLTSREFSPKWERERFKEPMRRRIRKWRRRAWSDKSDEDGKEETSEEEGVRSALER